MLPGAHRTIRTVRLGLRSLRLHPLRSILTVLGIFCGVAAVIVMLAYGEGTSYRAQEQIKALGSTNVILRSVKPPESQQAGAGRARLSEYGLGWDDVTRVRDMLPDADVLVPAREIVEDLRYEDRRSAGKIVATVPWYNRVTGQRVATGRFISDVEMTAQTNVCVLGAGVARELFPWKEAVGRIVRIKSHYFSVIGVMESAGRQRKLGGVDISGGDSSVFMPVTTARQFFGEIVMKVSTGSREFEKVEIHEISIRFRRTEDVLPAKTALEAMVARFHPREDVIVLAPLDLLNAAEKQKREFNTLLGAIAAVSLLVGGIGIMNIMLATVTERTREIGIRRALGAKRRDITLQFLVECVVLAGTGGVLGVLVGVGGPLAYQALTDTEMIVTAWSVAVSFGISVFVGLVFGIYPARRAARMDPIEALRHE